MSRLNRVEVQEFAFDLPDLGFDAGGFNIVYQPKNKLKLSKYAIAIETDDGARGEYVALWGGTKMALGQTLALAPHLLGRGLHRHRAVGSRRQATQCADLEDARWLENALANLCQFLSR